MLELLIRKHKRSQLREAHENRAYIIAGAISIKYQSNILTCTSGKEMYSVNVKFIWHILPVHMFTSVTINTKSLNITLMSSAVEPFRNL